MTTIDKAKLTAWIQSANGAAKIFEAKAFETIGSKPEFSQGAMEAANTIRANSNRIDLALRLFDRGSLSEDQLRTVVEELVKSAEAHAEVFKALEERTDPDFSQARTYTALATDLKNLL